MQHMQKTQVNGNYFVHMDQSGKQRELQVFNQFVNFGDQHFVMTTIRDMSYYLELERQRGISRMKTIAFAEAAHEFRNPLNGIVTSLDLLEEMIEKRSGAQYYNNARNCAQLMLYLVNDILDFAQLEDKKLILNTQSIHVDDLFEQVTAIFAF